MGRFARMPGAGLRASGLVVAALAILALGPTASASASTVFSNQVPAPDQVYTTFPVYIQVDADDSQYAFSDAEAYNQLYLNGTPQPTYQSLFGHWEDDGCSTWYVVDDATILTLSTPSLDLTDGEYTVLARTRNTAGQTSEASWDFTVAAPPRASSLTPAAPTLNKTPTISAVITDNGGGTPTVTMRVDGAIVTASYDPASRVVSYTPGAPLSDAVHTVSVEMSDTNGNTATANWSFSVQSPIPATFSARVPAPGATVASAYQTLSAVATSVNNLVYSSAKLFLDGTNVNAGVGQPNSKQLNIARSNVYLSDGSHTVRATVTDALGTATENTWTFTAAVRPTASYVQPANGSTVEIPRPTISVYAYDNSPGSLRVRMRLDGTEVFDSVVPQGTASWTPLSELPNNSVHTVSADITDAAGNVTTTSWTFWVVARPPMTWTCETCHSHDTSNCGSCHGGDYHSYSCGGCHDGDGHGPEILVGRCQECHGPGSARPAHEEAVTEAKHLTTTTGCEECHQTSLVTEHARYPSASDFKYQCTTCHASVDPSVQSAITNNRTDCPACHPGTGHPHPPATVADTPTGEQGEQTCKTCHSMDLVAEHAKATSSSSADPCETCHATGGPRDTVGTWDGTCSQGPCHAPGSARAVHDNYCYACHGASQPAFATSKVDFAASAVSRTRCRSCHWIGGHPNHYTKSVCTGCHTGWPARGPLYFSSFSDPRGYGVFRSAASPNTDGATLHAIHNRGSWPASLAPNQAACASCHAPARCEACHGAAPAHGGHGDTLYAKLTGRAASGAPSGSLDARGLKSVPGGTRGADLSTTAAQSCVREACHAIEGRSETSARSEEGAAVFGGSWSALPDALSSAGAIREARTVGATASFTFSGTGVSWIGRKSMYGGWAEVSLDGVVATQVNTQAQSSIPYPRQSLYAVRGLPPGTHTITVRILPNPTRFREAYTVVSVDAFDVVADSGPATRPFVPGCIACHDDRPDVHW